MKKDLKMVMQLKQLQRATSVTSYHHYYKFIAFKLLTIDQQQHLFVNYPILPLKIITNFALWSFKY